MKKTFALAFCLIALLLVLPTMAFADNGFVIDGAEDGYTYADGVLKFTKSGTYTISMAEGVASTTDHIEIDGQSVVNSNTSGASQDITLVLSNLTMVSDVKTPNIRFINSTSAVNACFDIQGTNSITNNYRGSTNQDGYCIGATSAVHHTVIGSGSLTLTSTRSSNWSGGTFTLDSKDVALKLNNCKIDVWTRVNINAGTLEINNTDDCILFSNKATGFTMTGGHVVLSTTGDSGIYFSNNDSSYIPNFTMEGGTLTITSAQKYGIVWARSNGQHMYLRGGEIEISGISTNYCIVNATNPAFDSAYTHKNYTRASDNTLTEIADSKVFNATGGIHSVYKYLLITPADEIEYELNGGEYKKDDGTVAEENPNPASYSRVDNFTLINPTREGFNFTGWTGSNGDTPEISVSVDGSEGLGKKEYSANWGHTVTFKVVNGSWNQGEGEAATADKTVTLTGSAGDTLKLTADQIPAVGDKPNDTYKAGGWDVTPSTETPITADTTYTYTYAAKEASVVTKPPKAKTLAYTGFAQNLVTAGEATGGTMQYALGTETEATGTWTATPTDITGTDAGTYYVWYKVKGDDNHSDTEPAPITVSIVDKLPLTITAAGASKTFDGTALTKNSYFTTGLAEGDKITSIKVTGSITSAGSAPNTASDAVITDSAGEDVTYKYEITYRKGTLVVVKKPVLVKADDKTKVYDNDPATDPELTATVTGEVKGYPVNYTLSREAGEAVGSYKITVTPGNNPNYVLSVTGAELTITEAPAPVYGEPDFTLPGAIKTIEANAFEGGAMSIVYVPDPCTAIGAGAFKDCAKLTQIRLPKNCAIGDGVFDGCGKVYVFAPAGGTTESWCQGKDNIVFVGMDN